MIDNGVQKKKKKKKNAHVPVPTVPHPPNVTCWHRSFGPTKLQLSDFLSP